MANNQLSVQQANIGKMKSIIASENVKNRMNDLLGREAGVFLASALDLYTSDTNLTQCDPTRVMAECMKAAALKMPVSKALGFCYVIPYSGVPQFQLGYRGLIQLAQRSGQYKYVNADMVYEGEEVTHDRITGMVMISGQATSEIPIGYFAYFQLLNGFEKCVYWSKEKVESHAKRYSKAWKKADSPWHTNFDAMALKTVIRNLISKYGVMSVEFATAIADDTDAEERIEAEVEANANKTPFTMLEAEEPDESPVPESVPAMFVDEEENPGF